MAGLGEYDRLAVEYHDVRDQPGRKWSYVTMVHARFKGRDYVLLTLYSTSVSTGWEFPAECYSIERTPDEHVGSEVVADQ